MLSGNMPARRSEREGNASHDASTSAPDASVGLPTTRSGLVRQALELSTPEENASARELGVGTLLPSTSQPVAPSQPDYVKVILQSNAELSVQVKRMSETYERALRTITAEAERYREESEKARAESIEGQSKIYELQEEITSLKAHSVAAAGRC